MIIVAALYGLIRRAHGAALDALRRGDRSGRYYAWAALSGVLSALLITSLAAFATILVAGGLWWLAALLFAYLGVPALEPWLARHVYGRLGWAQVAYWTARIDTAKDPEAYALCAAARAYAFAPSASGEAFVIARRDRRKPLGDAEVIASGLLAAGRGDADTARALLRSTVELVEVHPRIRELAGEWLAVDAAARGAWRELREDGVAARWPASTLTFFLEGVAARAVGAPHAPGRLAMYARWLLAPMRRATAPLLAVTYRAEAPVRSPTAAPAPATHADADVDATPLASAIAAHIASTSAPSVFTLSAAVARWDAALADDSTRQWLQRRALELDAPLGAVDRALADVAAAITSELADVATDAQLAAPDHAGAVGRSLAHRLRHGRLDALETAFTRWLDRKHAGQHLPAIDEWREWLALRTAYDDAARVGGLSLRRIAFPHAYHCAHRMAVWLWNERHEYALSHAMHRWLYAEALVVGDTAAIELCAHNARIAVKTRTGHVTPTLHGARDSQGNR